MTILASLINTTILIQLGHTAMHTITLRHPETTYPNLHMGIHALMREHVGRKFAYKSNATSDWQHGTRNSLYDYMTANIGKTVYVRLYTDVTKYRTNTV